MFEMGLNGLLKEMDEGDEREKSSYPAEGLLS
jgi:hypothetical protein